MKWTEGVREGMGNTERVVLLRVGFNGSQREIQG